MNKSRDDVEGTRGEVEFLGNDTSHFEPGIK
jgi:hypothetical protein